MARDVRGLNFLGLRMTFSSLERIQFFYLETLSTSDLEFLLTWFAYQVSRIEQVVSEPLAQPLEDRRKLDSGGAVMRHEPQASPEVGSVDSGAPSGVVIPFTNPRMSA